MSQTVSLQWWTNNKTNKSYKQLIYIHISCKCDTNRAGHFTLDAHASRPVACQLRLCLSGWEIKMLFSWNSVSKMTVVSNSAPHLSKSMANPLSNPTGNVAPRWVYQAILVEMTDKTLYGLRATQRHKEIRGIFNGGDWWVTCCKCP